MVILNLTANMVVGIFVHCTFRSDGGERNLGTGTTYPAIPDTDLRVNLTLVKQVLGTFRAETA